jgi:hypothetical protein
MKLSNVMVSYTIFSLIISLFVGAYGAAAEAYSVTSDTDVGTRLNDLNLISAMAEGARGMNQLANPGSFLDIVGGLLSIGIGILKGLTALLTTPLEILDILMDSYNIPGVIYAFVGAIMLIYGGFIIIKAYTGQEH